MNERDTELRTLNKSFWKSEIFSSNLYKERKLLIKDGIKGNDCWLETRTLASRKRTSRSMWEINRFFKQDIAAGIKEEDDSLRESLILSSRKRISRSMWEVNTFFKSHWECTTDNPRLNNNNRLCNILSSSQRAFAMEIDESRHVKLRLHNSWKRKLHDYK